MIISHKSPSSGGRVADGTPQLDPLLDVLERLESLASSVNERLDLFAYKLEQLQVDMAHLKKKFHKGVTE